MKLSSGDLNPSSYSLTPQKLYIDRITITLRVSSGILKLNLKILEPSLYENILGLTVFGCCKTFSGKYIFSKNANFRKMKMFLGVWLHFNKFSRKYFLVFGKEEGKHKSRKTQAITQKKIINDEQPKPSKMHQIRQKKPKPSKRK